MTNVRKRDNWRRKVMRVSVANGEWDSLSYVEKNRKLFAKQKQLLDAFYKHKAISKYQYDEEIHYPEDKMQLK